MESAWCQEFAAITTDLQALHASTSHWQGQPVAHQQESGIYDRLASLAQNFTVSARQYGRIIISERALPVAEKTIKPTNLGGVAGGEKFICRGILFKFSGDDEKACLLYGSTANAIKASNLDLLVRTCLEQFCFLNAAL